MAYEWDEAKRLSNLKKHGVDFADVEAFDWENAHIELDDRFDYGEERLYALGFLRGEIYSISYTERNETIRIISFRKAEKREAWRYEKAKNQS
jgi:uncharacterized DUF497 family protein